MTTFQELPPFPQNAKSVEDSEVKRWFDIASKAINDIQNVFIITSSFTETGLQSKVSTGRFHGRELTSADNYIDIIHPDGADGNIQIGLKNLPTIDPISKKNDATFIGAAPIYYNVTLTGLTGGGTEDTMHSYDFLANTFVFDGDRCIAEMAGDINDSGGFATYIRLYVGGTKCFDTGNFTPSATQYWSMKIYLNRISFTQLQVITNFFTDKSGITPIATITNVTLDFTTSINIHTTATSVILTDVVEQFITTINYEKCIL